METRPTKIYPSVLTSDGRTIYPTGIEWIIAFALRGVPWAIEAWKEWEAGEGERWAGDGI